MTIKHKIVIGADPELFCYIKTTGTAISVHDFLPGSKVAPMTVPLGAIQVDGVAAEFNIRPADTQKKFIKHINSVRSILDLLVKRENEDYHLLAVPTANFKEDYFNALPENVRELGCQPDFNAYTGEANPKPETKEPFRTGAGHIHIGWTENVEPTSEGHFKACKELTQELDKVLYISSLVWDDDQKRRELYGKPGAFRPKPYGLEYRVLSNAWLNCQQTQEFVFDASQAMANLFFKGFRISEHIKTNEISDLDGYCETLAKYNIPNVQDYLDKA